MAQKYGPICRSIIAARPQRIIFAIVSVRARQLTAGDDIVGIDARRCLMGIDHTHSRIVLRQRPYE